MITSHWQNYASTLLWGISSVLLHVYVNMSAAYIVVCCNGSYFRKLLPPYLGLVIATRLNSVLRSHTAYRENQLNKFSNFFFRFSAEDQTNDYYGLLLENWWMLDWHPWTTLKRLFKQESRNVTSVSVTFNSAGRPRKVNVSTVRSEAANQHSSPYNSNRTSFFRKCTLFLWI